MSVIEKKVAKAAERLAEVMGEWPKATHVELIARGAKNERLAELTFVSPFPGGALPSPRLRMLREMLAGCAGVRRCEVRVWSEAFLRKRVRFCLPD